MNADEIREHLADVNPEAILAVGFEKALLGLAHRCGKPPLAAYSVKRCIDIIMAEHGVRYEDAIQIFEFNVAGAWVGEQTPVWVYDEDGSEEVDDSYGSEDSAD